MNTIRSTIQKQIIPGVLLFLFCTGLEVNAAKEIILNNKSHNSTNIIENTYSCLKVSNTISSFSTLLLNTDKGEFVELQISSYSKTNTIGSPQLPVLSKLIKIPEGSTPEVKIISYDVKEYKLADFGITQKLFPVQAPQSKSDLQVKPLAFNQQVYQNNSFYGEARARVEIAGFLRGIQLANLILSPIEYNPVTNTIRVYDNLVVEINFSGVNNFKSTENRAKTDSPYYKSVFSNVLNHKPADKESEALPGVPVKYVIVADPMFRDALQPFVKWKTKRGFRVIEAYTDNPAVGTSLSSIKAYLHNLYTSATSTDPAPTFVLFAGDVAQIPAFDCGDHVSDLYYCEYTGDYLPEVFYGRFSANTVAELLPQISKTLQYEQYLMPDPSYLNEVVMAAGADATHQARWGNGQVNYATTYYLNSAHNLVPHTFLQPEPAGSNYSKTIQANISNGVSYANYSAHGSPEGWADPLFTISDVAKLKNFGKYCIIVGNSCQTNAYDNNSFGEALLRADNKGALGYIGASGLSYWDEDYWWSVGAGSVVTNPTYETTGPGMYDRIFHDHGEPQSERYSTLGQMLFAGNLAVQESNSGMKKYYWEIYCLMGDPSTMVYFGVPAPLFVEYNTILPLGTSTFEVRTEPLASVAISKNSILYGVAEADENGLAVVTLQPFTEPGYADIVITKQNRQPFIDSLEVVSPAGPYLLLKNFAIKDSGGNNNQLPEYGEPLIVNIILDNAGNSDARNAVSKLSTNDSYFIITDDTYSWSSIAGKSTATAPDAFKLQVSENIPDMHSAIFAVTTQTDSGSFKSEFNVLFYAPALSIGTITLDDITKGNGNGRIDPGETLIIKVPVTNSGHSISGEVTTQLFVFDDNGTINASPFNIGELIPGATGNSTFSFTVSPDAQTGSVLSLFISAAAGPYNSVSSLTPIIGTKHEDFETGDFQNFSWLMKGIKPWEISASEKSEGMYSAKSGALHNSERSVMILEGQVLFTDTISFYRKVSSENGYDFLTFYMDDAVLGTWDGNKDWGKVSYPVSAGKHRFSWIYEKDEATSAGLDAAWVDNIRLPAFSQASAEPLSVKVVAVPATICAGGQSQLYAFTTGGTGEFSYTWTPAAKLGHPGIMNPSVSPQETTTFDVSVGSGFLSATGNITVTVEQSPSSPVVTVYGGHLVSSALAGNQWYNSRGMIPGATDQTYFPPATETYYVINNANGCPSSASNEVLFGFTDVISYDNNGFSVYPNPFVGKIYIDYSTKSSGQVKIVLYSSTGKEIGIIEEGNKTAGDHQAVFDGSHLPSGIYIFKIESVDKVQLAKVIKY